MHLYVITKDAKDVEYEHGPLRCATRKQAEKFVRRQVGVNVIKWWVVGRDGDVIARWERT